MLVARKCGGLVQSVVKLVFWVLLAAIVKMRFLRRSAEVEWKVRLFLRSVAAKSCSQLDISGNPPAGQEA